MLNLYSNVDRTEESVYVMYPDPFGTLKEVLFL